MAGCYEEDRRMGCWRMLDEQGRLRAVLHFKKGSKDGAQAYWNERHVLVRLEHFKMGVPNGQLLKFYDDGAPEQWSTFQNGVMEGAHYHWWRQGDRPTSALVGWFSGGQNTGEWIEMTPDHQIIWQAIFRDGRVVRTIVARKKF